MKIYATYSDRLSLIKITISSIVLKYQIDEEFIFSQSIEKDENWLTKLLVQIY